MNANVNYDEKPTHVTLNYANVNYEGAFDRGEKPTHVNIMSNILKYIDAHNFLILRLEWYMFLQLDGVICPCNNANALGPNFLDD